ncbi:nitric oxide synthase oxygenase [Polyangium spumosum]|uniref:Cyclic nucleotide-binding domain-containing protein n=1 Tax=Polyangium spumosum TaxID=889282 RepID=A0A6N7PTX5_9BACT|nr:nitric oxide synthase oxygenase [Polyangium spumosum]MRG95369.1 cyclic nucleotide-binding domain-containing protein [Polyangium spumosum]
MVKPAMMTHEIESLIREAGLLEGLGQDAADALLERTVVQRYESGAQIVREGEIGDAAFVLVEGICQVFGARPGGGVIRLARLEPGALFGEQALLGRAGGRRAATVRATGPVAVARIAAQDFRNALPPDHPRREALVRLGEEQLRDRLVQQSSLFRTLRALGGEHGGLDAELVTYERGEALFYQGEPADAVYVVVSGAVGVYVDKDGRPQLLTRVEAGHCVGERGLLRRESRAATAVVEDPVTAFRIPGDRFLALLERSPELREYLDSLESVYELPHRGFVTIFAGRFLGKPCITSLYHLPRGRHALASHVPGEELHHLTVSEPGLEGPHDERGKHRFVDARRGLEREIVVTPDDGRILSFTARGDWVDLPKLYALALEGGSLSPWQCAAFSETGSIDLESPPSLVPDDEIVCTCLRVRRRDLRRAILAGCNTPEAIRDKTRAGSACGACLPRIADMLGKSAWTAAEIVSTVDVCPGVRAFRLVPRGGAPIPAEPGQHIVIQAEIDGRFIERPYTLSAPTTSGHYEITVKRLQGGVFTTWLFERRPEDALIRVSAPGGHFTLPRNDRPVVYLVAGIGVTPAIAAVRAIREEGASRRVHVDYSAHSPASAPYADELHALAAACPNVTARIRFTEVWGRLGKDELASLVEAHPDAEWFLCGPIPYLRAMSQLLLEQGVLDTHLHIEEFIAGSVVVAQPGRRPSLLAPPMSAPPVPLSPSFPTSLLPKAPPPVAITYAPSSPARPAAPAAAEKPRAEGGCPFAHGTHREDGLGVIPPIVAGQDSSVAEEARAYLAQFYREKGAPRAFAVRWVEVAAELERTGTYVQTYDELSFGAKLAWRNSTRCVGRLFWSGLEVRDMRHLKDEDEILSALVEHIELATHGGNLRAMMTVLAPADRAGEGPRVWNGQLLRYAGYPNPDGTVTGDPMNVELTRKALELGWKGGPRTRFDLLPLIVKLPGRAPRWKEIPRRVVREVPLVHPDLPWFASLGLKWYALPAVAELLLDLGGVKYTAAPFNGWYMATEIGARNFSDPHRYNMLPVIADRLGLDTQRASSLWRDRAQVELTRAVVHSFERAGVKIVDHHTASEDFLQFAQAEEGVGRCVHMRWSWIVPPIGSSATSVFHMDEDHHPDISLKPNLFYQPKPWATPA